MSNSNGARWCQRLEHFQRAMRRLDEACAMDKFSELELAGLIQTYEFCFELAWKTLKDLIYVEGIELASPRSVLRQAHEMRLVEDIDGWLRLLESRNVLSHVYDDATAAEAERLIKDSYHPLLRRLVDVLIARRDAE